MSRNPPAWGYLVLDWLAGSQAAAVLCGPRRLADILIVPTLRRGNGVSTALAVNGREASGDGGSHAGALVVIHKSFRGRENPEGVQAKSLRVA